ncbi:hypothetical protein DPMN_145537 [Dreissena polymorpha]|uniref:Uncharacterized protein n=1 Tax=Dreissena polymorpha TaxID=45954 RepID=A0A9D4J1A3_DREPO|nr:hypothetical protein DPMN_145537 [Dreissena polymorpha]
MVRKKPDSCLSYLNLSFKEHNTREPETKDIIRTNVLTKFHEEINSPPPGGHVFQQTGNIFKLIRDIIKTNVLTKFHEDWTINVAVRVLTRFTKANHVFRATRTIFEPAN